jgi:hypothetical protein
MGASRGLLLLIGVGLLTGCVAKGSSKTDDVSSSLPPPLPTDGESLHMEVPEGETPEAPVNRPTPGVTPPAERSQPPSEELESPLRPVSIAQFDLARRLRIKPAWVEVIEVTIREPDPETMPCLASDAVADALPADLSQVWWITLSAKGSLYHYVAAAGDVFYCNE